MDNQVTNFRVEMFSVNYVIFRLLQTLFSHDSLKNVAGIDVFK